MRNKLSPTQDRMDRAASRTSAAAPLRVATQADAAPRKAGSARGFGRGRSRLLSDRIHRDAVPAIRSRLTADLPVVLAALALFGVFCAVGWGLGGGA